MPKYNLSIGGGSHGQNTGRMLEAIENVLASNSFDATLVYGDTDSTLAGALASSKLHIPILHVEAGLRSFNRRMPEEINRILTDHISHICFAPTQKAKHQLLSEGIPESKINVVGDVMLDAMMRFSKMAEKLAMPKLQGLSSFNRDYILATIHRAENTDNKNRLKTILSALNMCKYPVVMPLHPRTKKRIEEFSLQHLLSNVEVISPAGFLEMISLLERSKIVVTDSGGLQKEAYFSKTPCVTVRTETEWSELLLSGWNILADPTKGIEYISRAIESQADLDLNLTRPMYYGEGKASEAIASCLLTI